MKSILYAALFTALSLPLFVAQKADASSKKVVDVAVTEKGFEPKSIDVPPGSDVTLKVTRKTDSTCAKEVQVPTKNLKAELPLDKPVALNLGKLAKGEVRFGCGMDMMEAAQINVK